MCIHDRDVPMVTNNAMWGVYLCECVKLCCHRAWILVGERDNE